MSTRPAGVLIVLLACGVVTPTRLDARQASRAAAAEQAGQQKALRAEPHRRSAVERLLFKLEEPGLLSSAEYIVATITTSHPDHARWSQPVRANFKRDGGSWKTVGLKRQAGSGLALHIYQKECL